MVSWSEVRIKWDVVNDFRECIHDFVLSFYNTKGLQVFTTNEYEYLVTNLTVCSWYLVTVTSRTLHGTFIGKASEINVKTKALSKLKRSFFNFVIGDVACIYIYIA